MTDAYQDGVRSASVPAFVVSAKQLLRSISGTTHRQRSARTPTTGANNVALGSRATNKRNADVIDLVSSSPKRSKTEQPPSRHVIDLTQEDEPPAKFLPTRRLPLRPALANITNRGTAPKPSQKRHKNPRPAPVPDIHGESLGTLAKIASKLRASAHALDLDRETLRRRWEVDEMLQLQHITDNLAELNEYFTTTENGIYAALDVIEKRLL